MQQVTHSSPVDINQSGRSQTPALKARPTDTSVLLQQVTYSSSVDIRPEWPVVESIPFTSLAKLNFQVGKPEDIAFCGSLEYYDKVYDRVTPKADRPLKRTNKVFKSVTTSDDPVIRYRAD